jgi:phage terminase large subunit-like protein
LTLEQFAGQRCWIGGDLALDDDMSAVALLFEHEAAIAAFVKFYLPRDVVAERARTVPAYALWVKAGILETTDGSRTDVRRIEADIRAWCRRFAVVALRFDQFGSTAIVGDLASDSFPAAILDKNAKNFTRPAYELESRVKYGQFRHDGNPCLKWNASNAVVTRGVDGSILPKKEDAKSPNKIDGIDAILQALSAMLTPAAAAPSYSMTVLG